MRTQGGGEMPPNDYPPGRPASAGRPTFFFLQRKRLARYARTIWSVVCFVALPFIPIIFLITRHTVKTTTSQIHDVVSESTEETGGREEK